MLFHIANRCACYRSLSQDAVVIVLHPKAHNAVVLFGTIDAAFKLASHASRDTVLLGVARVCLASMTRTVPVLCASMTMLLERVCLDVRTLHCLPGIGCKATE